MVIPRVRPAAERHCERVAAVRVGGGCAQIGVSTIVEVDARPIGDGKPGPVTARFLEQFKACVTKNGTHL